MLIAVPAIGYLAFNNDRRQNEARLFDTRSYVLGMTQFRRIHYDHSSSSFTRSTTRLPEVATPASNRLFF